MNNANETPVLKNRMFLIFWAGQMVSHLGDVLYSLALMWWVVKVTGSTMAMSSVALAGAVPRILLGPVAGVYVDRMDRRKLMLWTNILLGLVTLVIAYFFWTDNFSLPLLLVSSVIFAVLTTAQTPAFEASVPVIVGSEQLVRANSLMQSARSFIGIGAPAISGVIIGFYGVGASIVTNAVTFFFAGFSLLLISIPSPSRGIQAKSVLRDSGTGFKFIFSRTMLWSMLLFFAVVNLTLSPLGVILPLFVVNVLATGPAVMGLFGSAQSAGVLAGSSLVSAFPALLKRTGLAIIYSICTIGLSIALIGLVPGTTTFVAGAVLLGISVVCANVAAQAIWQREVPDELRGRVFAARHSFSTALTPLGMAVAGVLGGFIGPATFLAGSGLLCMFTGLLGFLVPGLGRYPFNSEQGQSTAANL